MHSGDFVLMPLMGTLPSLSWTAAAVLTVSSWLCSYLMVTSATAFCIQCIGINVGSSLSTYLACFAWGQACWTPKFAIELNHTSQQTPCRRICNSWQEYTSKFFSHRLMPLQWFLQCTVVGGLQQMAAGKQTCLVFHMQTIVQWKVWNLVNNEVMVEVHLWLHRVATH